MSETSNFRKLSVDLPIKIYDDVSALAKKRNISRKAVICEMLKTQLTNQDNKEIPSHDYVDSLKANIAELTKRLTEKQVTLESTTKSLELANESTIKAQQLNAHDKQQLSIYQQTLAEATKPKSLLQRLISVVVPERLPAIEAVKPDDYLSSVISPVSAVSSDGDGG